MIFVDDRRIDFTSFPDGTSSIRIAPKLDFTFFAMGKSAYFIRWMYDNDAECMQLWYLVKHLKSAGNPLLYLEMPYIPNARMDRVKNRDEVFTLKWFAEFINSLGFESVKVLDPHSNVAMALINRAETMDVKHYIDYAIQWIVSQGMNPLLCYPDEGAAKRYSELLPMPKLQRKRRKNLSPTSKEKSRSLEEDFNGKADRPYRPHIRYADRYKKG